MTDTHRDVRRQREPKQTKPDRNYGLDLERTVLASMLFTAEFGKHGTELLKSQDFADPMLRLIFETAVTTIAGGKRGTLLDVSFELKRTGAAIEPAFLTDLSQAAQPMTLADFEQRIADLHELRLRESVAAKAETLKAVSTDHTQPIAALTTALDDLGGAVQVATRSRAGGSALEVLSLDALLSANPDPQAWLISHLLPRQGVIVLGGRIKEGKTLLALQTSLCVAANREPWAGAEIGRPGPVIFVGQEGSRNSFVERIQRQCKALGISDSGLPFHLITRPKRERLVIGGDLWLELEALCSSVKPVLVVFDPLTWLSDADENANDEMSRMVMLPLQQFAARHDTLVLVIHHVSKPTSETRGKAPDPKEYVGSLADEFRGASAIASGSDGNILWKEFQQHECFRLAAELRDSGDLIAWFTRSPSSLVYEVTEAPISENETLKQRALSEASLITWLASQSDAVSVDAVHNHFQVAWQTASKAVKEGIASGVVIEEKAASGGRIRYRIAPGVQVPAPIPATAQTTSPVDDRTDDDLFPFS